MTLVQQENTVGLTPAPIAVGIATGNRRKPYLGRGGRIQRLAATFWLRHLFWSARNAPRYAQASKRWWLNWTWFFASKLRQTTTANAARLLGPTSNFAEQQALARRILGSFYDFVTDLGAARRLSLPGLQARIAAVEGQEHFEAARALRRGAIVAVAHFGSFEVGIAALRARERHVHVIFRRDPFDQFEKTRAEVRQRFGVQEVPLDEGTATWMRLRAALERDEVVLIQADRVLPDQKGQAVPFMGGRVLLPTGPVKLAIISGAPIIPVFTHRLPDGRVKLIVEPPILPQNADVPRGQPHPALLQLAQVIEKHVRQDPSQWLMLQPAWIEDQSDAALARYTSGGQW